MFHMMMVSFLAVAEINEPTTDKGRVQCALNQEIKAMIFSLFFIMSTRNEEITYKIVYHSRYNRLLVAPCGVLGFLS